MIVSRSMPRTLRSWRSAPGRIPDEQAEALTAATAPARVVGLAGDHVVSAGAGGGLRPNSRRVNSSWRRPGPWPVEARVVVQRTAFRSSAAAMKACSKVSLMSRCLPWASTPEPGRRRAGHRWRAGAAGGRPGAALGGGISSRSRTRRELGGHRRDDRQGPGRHRRNCNRTVASRRGQKAARRWPRSSDSSRACDPIVVMPRRSSCRDELVALVAGAQQVQPDSFELEVVQLPQSALAGGRARS